MTQISNLTSILGLYTKPQLNTLITGAVRSWADAAEFPKKPLLMLAVEKVLARFPLLRDGKTAARIIRNASTLRWQDIDGMPAGVENEIDLTAEQRTGIVVAVITAIMMDVADKAAALQALTTPDLAALLAEQAAHDEAELAGMNPVEEEVGGE